MGKRVRGWRRNGDSSGCGCDFWRGTSGAGALSLGVVTVEKFGSERMELVRETGGEASPP